MKGIFNKFLLQELIPGTESYKADKIFAKPKNCESSDIENMNNNS